MDFRKRDLETSELPHILEKSHAPTVLKPEKPKLHRKSFCLHSVSDSFL